MENSSKVGVQNKIFEWDEQSPYGRVKGMSTTELIQPALFATLFYMLFPKFYTKQSTIGQGTAIMIKYAAAGVPLSMAWDVVIEKDSGWVERFFDVDNGWITKFLVLLAIYLALA